MFIVLMFIIKLQKCFGFPLSFSFSLVFFCKCAFLLEHVIHNQKINDNRRGLFWLFTYLHIVFCYSDDRVYKQSDIFKIKQCPSLNFDLIKK